MRQSGVGAAGAAICLAALLTAFPAGVRPALGGEVKLKSTAQSAAEVELTADGVVVMHARNSRLMPYAVFDGERQLPRLATVTTDVRERTDAEGYDPASTVSVLVIDVSQGADHPLAEFIDPGTDGAMLSDLYFDSSMPGCCGGPTLHAVRSLEDGKLIYRATGDGAGGSSAWAEAPNTRPALRRWAAFDGAVSPEDLQRGVAGFLSYGSGGETLSRLELRATGEGVDTIELNLGLSHGATLQWVDEKSQKAGYEPSSGSAANPAMIWSLDGMADAQRVGGFSLQLQSYEGVPLAMIPIVADRLDGDKATMGEGLALAPPP